ncbi:acyl-CoA thioesterase, partial [Pseudoalteromonas piscicida]
MTDEQRQAIVEQRIKSSITHVTKTVFP